MQVIYNIMYNYAQYMHIHVYVRMMCDVICTHTHTYREMVVMWVC